MASPKKVGAGVPFDTLCRRLKQGFHATIPGMNRGTSSAPNFLMRARYPMALGLGLFLGQAVSLMAERQPTPTLGFAISTVFIAAASASFVLFVLGQQRAPAPRPVLWRKGRTLAGLIGLGLLLSLRAVDLLA